MTIVVLTNCPPKLRGDMTKWFIEINTGVYVGRINSRVRQELWKRICENVKNGQATMVFPAQGEQHMDVWVHNTTWRPVDYDGIKLMCRPGSNFVEEENAALLREGFSKAAKAKKYGNVKRREYSSTEERYVVLDIETSALRPTEGQIIEIGAVLVKGDTVQAEFSRLVKADRPLSKEITELTGITDEMLRKKGVSLQGALEEFIAFAGTSLLVCHNASFDQTFVNAAISSLHFKPLANKWKDTLIMARKRVRSVQNYRLETLLKHFGIPTECRHRALEDARATQLLYEKLKQSV